MLYIAGGMATIPEIFGGLQMGWNHSGGGEINFLNGGTGGNPGFQWLRATGGGGSFTMASLDALGGLTLSGPLLLPSDPTSALQGATKQYSRQRADARDLELLAAGRRCPFRQSHNGRQ